VIRNLALKVGFIVADMIDVLFPAPNSLHAAEDAIMDHGEDARPLIDEDAARSLWKAVVSMTEKSMASVRDSPDPQVELHSFDNRVFALAGTGSLATIYGMGRSYGLVKA
jgi:hypothetical protein